jgi:hypothetical protein
MEAHHCLLRFGERVFLGLHLSVLSRMNELPPDDSGFFRFMAKLSLFYLAVLAVIYYFKYN